MGRPRSNLQALLKTITANVYFQPPPADQIKYPCIVYEIDDDDVKFANNLPYQNTDRYQVTVIDTNADSPIKVGVRALPMCLFQRYFRADNLHHFVFDLYY